MPILRLEGDSSVASLPQNDNPITHPSTSGSLRSPSAQDVITQLPNYPITQLPMPILRLEGDSSVASLPQNDNPITHPSTTSGRSSVRTLPALRSGCNPQFTINRSQFTIHNSAFPSFDFRLTPFAFRSGCNPLSLSPLPIPTPYPHSLSPLPIPTPHPSSSTPPADTHLTDH